MQTRSMHQMKVKEFCIQTGFIPSISGSQKMKNKFNMGLGYIHGVLHGLTMEAVVYETPEYEYEYQSNC